MRYECTPVNVLVGRWLVDEVTHAKMEALVQQLGLTLFLHLTLSPAQEPSRGVIATITIRCKGLDARLQGCLTFDIVPAPSENDPAQMLATFIAHADFQRKFILAYVARLQACEHL